MKCETSVKHSPITNNLNYSFLILSAFILLLAAPRMARAQMFSVGEEGSRFNSPETGIYLGVEPMTVTYTGNNTSTTALGQFEFSGPLLRLGYNTPSLDLSMGVGGEVTGIKNDSYFDIGGSIDLGFQIHRSQKITIRLPIKIESRFVNMTNNQLVATRYNRFRFGSLTAGAGAHIMVRPAKDIRIAASAVPSYGFAFASGGLFGGGLGSVDTRGRLFFDRLFGKYGLSVGYGYDHRSYDIDENMYDYKMKGHILEVGITF